ncbi:MAG: Transketolase domain-containing protein [Candidatus Roizmanbacteria bacterium GW2011_GWA2_37_7]|uniref:Transketolase domain-containing protein n=1 Tax=Candidatus Roizmanbacteria bacterium GW2011_GWA2_37_7 TaxID=1618481 RepID=A0A0G0H422_9BACT|nr:MAG: Transketolase domain-containing protein [Candidatus Roizmanbacteria bacterium GW2011_GWA2_37_7]
MQNKDLKRRIIDISFKKKLSHIGSCLTCVDIIEEIYRIKNNDEKFVLSPGHAGLALYVVNEKYYRVDAEQAFEHHGTHPDRCKKCKIDCSTGSLGQGLPIALGMALANPKKNVYCIFSDGECSEGSIWEALRIKTDNKVKNLKIYVNINGWGAYQKINTVKLINRLKTFDPTLILRKTKVEQLPFLKGQNAHYHIMSKSDYIIAQNILK